MDDKQLINIATKISTPLSLSSLTILILYGLYKILLGLNIFPELSEGSGFNLLNNIINKVFILAFIALVLGMLAFAYSIYLDHKTPTLRNVDDWKSVSKGILKLRKKIHERSFDPEIVIGLGVGGSVVAGLLAGCLGRKPIVGIDRRYQWENGERKTYVNVPKSLQIEPTPKRALLVTGEIYGATSILKAIDMVKTNMGCDIVTASMYVWENSEYYPDIYAYSIENRVQPPWRLEGDIRDSKADREISKGAP